MSYTRRAAISGLAGSALAGVSVGAPAQAASVPAAVLRHPGYRGWTQPPARPTPVPLDLELTLPTGDKKSLRQWLGGKPAILVLWATWCPPCMVEKPRQALLEAKLARAGIPSRIKGLQAYDEASLGQGQAFARRLGAGNLDLARAGEPMERAFLDVFGRSPIDPKRTSLPALVLLSPQGVEMGRAMGTMETLFGGSYWQKKSTFDFLSNLDKLA